jgi:hypothetical protein
MSGSIKVLIKWKKNEEIEVVWERNAKEKEKGEDKRERGCVGEKQKN